MKHFHNSKRFISSSVALLALAALVASAQPVAAENYVWNRVGNQAWRNAINWLPNSSYPKLPGDTATFNLNTPQSSSTNLNETVTIGALNVNGASDATNAGLAIGPGNSPDHTLVFGTVTGNATYTETPDPAPGTGTVQVNAKVRLDANLNANVHSTLTFANTVSGAGSLTVNGPGQVVLQTANTYGAQGGTTVNAGSRLAVSNPDGSATGEGPVVVHGTLGGGGIITGPVTFGGGSLAPASLLGPATLTLGTTVFADDAASARFLLGSISDFVQVNGNLTLDGSLELVNAGDLTSGFYPLFGYTGTLTNNGLAITEAPNQFAFELDFSQAGLVGVVVTAVPEPATYVLGAFGLIGLLAVRRRQRLA